MSTDRMLRVNSLIKREMGQILQDHKKELWSAFITVTDAQVSRDLKIAKIYVSIMADDEKKDRIIRRLQQFRPYYFQQLSKRIRLKSIPKLEFVLDVGTEHSDHIFKLLEEIKRNESWGDASDESTEQ